MTPLVTSANSAIPIGYRKKIASDVGADIQKHAAGVIFMAPDGDILLLRRAGTPGVDNYVGHWALPGGGGEDGEQPEDTARRESREEMGVDISDDTAPMKPIDRRVTPNGMVFHTFVSPTQEKFAPKLNAEHSGYAWAPLNMLPRPMHPAVEATLKDQIGVAEDMKPDEWDGLRDGFMKWTAEEAREPEHAEDAALALDRDSVRTKDRTGRLKVARTHISKANVCPYRGHEIPQWQELGLDADKIYNLYRDPEELKKAAPTLNGVPLLRRHIPVSAADHQPHEVVGSVGSEAEFDGEYLDNSLFVNSQEAIDGIEAGQKRELSAGYHYRADMTPGTVNGTAFDGVMRDIEFNHVALVEDGRAGPDVVVGDSTENLKMKPTRLAARSLLMTGACMSPILAMDAVLPKSLFVDINTKNFAAKKPLIIDAVKKAVTGKTRKGMALDETLLSKLLDDVGSDDKDEADKPVSEKQHEALQAAAHGSEELGIPKATGGEEFVDHDTGKKKPAYDAEAVKDWLRGKGMSEDDMADFDTTFSAPASTDEDPDDKDADKDKKKPVAEDEDPDEKKDEKKDKGAQDMKDVVTKPAMDQAIKSAVETATKTVRETERGIRAAIAAVKPWIGEVRPDMAFDSAADVHRHALKAIGVENADKMHADALLPVLQAQPKPGARPNVVDRQPLGMDAAAADSLSKMVPGLERIGFA